MVEVKRGQVMGKILHLGIEEPTLTESLQVAMKRAESNEYNGLFLMLLNRTTGEYCYITNGMSDWESIAVIEIYKHGILNEGSE